MSLTHRTDSNPNLRRKPQSEWATPGVFDPATDYESNLDDGRAQQRKHNIDGATAATTGQAGLDEGAAHKDRLR